MNPVQIQEYTKAIAKALASNQDVIRYGGVNSADSILNAYMTNDWSGVTNLTGKPFSRKEQEAAVTKAERDLAPAYRAQEDYDRAATEQSLAEDQAGFGQFQKQEAESFRGNKNLQDQNAADQGVLFSGSRFQKLNDLRNTFADREAAQRAAVAGRVGTTARAYQYQYGNTGANKLSNLYNLPGQSNFNTNVGGGKVTPSNGLSSVYNTKNYNFQGTAPVAQKAAVQTRAAGLLQNTANKLSLTGYKNKL